MRYRLPSTIVLAGAIAATVAACGSSPPARFYTLAPIPTEAVQPVGQRAIPISVSIAPVELPDVLDRSPIVTRDGDNTLHLAEFHRWAGSLGENITTVLVENLSGLLASDRVFAYPGLRPEIPDFRVGVRVLRLDCVSAERVELKAQWLVATGQEKEEVAGGVSTFTETVADGSYDALVAAVNRTVAELSREIARAMTVPKNALSTAPPTPRRW